MNHRKIGRNFSRTTSHRKAMFQNMCCSFIEHKEIKTTLQKAKEFRRHIEPLITLAKNDTLQARRRAFAKLRDEKALSKLFLNIAPANKERPGGYVRIYKIGFRKGDAAPMALVQLCSEAEEVLDK
jgi:large subunit ribosomal protein L17